MTKQAEKLAKAIGKRLEAMLKERGYQQWYLAKKSGLSQAAINRYINGKRTPTAESILAMAKVLKCTTDDILIGNSHN